MPSGAPKGSTVTRPYSHSSRQVPLLGKAGAHTVIDVCKLFARNLPILAFDFVL